MLLQHIFEFDTSIGFFHLLDAPLAEIVQLAVVDLRSCRQHVHHYADLHVSLNSRRQMRSSLPWSVALIAWRKIGGRKPVTSCVVV